MCSFDPVDEKYYMDAEGNIYSEQELHETGLQYNLVCLSHLECAFLSHLECAFLSYLECAAPILSVPLPS